MVLRERAARAGTRRDRRRSGRVLVEIDPIMGLVEAGQIDVSVHVPIVHHRARAGTVGVDGARVDEHAVHVFVDGPDGVAEAAGDELEVAIAVDVGRIDRVRILAGRVDLHGGETTGAVPHAHSHGVGEHMVDGGVDAVSYTHLTLPT